MKIKIIKRPYDEVMKVKRAPHRKPRRTDIFFRTLLKLVALPDLWATHFKCERVGMEKLGRDEPCLILMNHSSFIDLEIAASVLYPRHFNIVATTDGFIGKDLLMHLIGCIPIRKFVHDPTVVRDMLYAVRNKKNSIVLYPEAGYTFDGTTTTLPESVPKLVKMLGIPLVSITTHGAFSRDPLYNNLQRRKVNVSATLKYVLSPDEIKEMPIEEIKAVVDRLFDFDGFRWQQENGVRITEPTRADFLNRVLYKCPHCLTEGKMHGEGVTLTCGACGKSWTLDELGFMRANEGDSEFPHIPDWYAWERECVKREIEEGRYSLDLPVDICMSIDTKRLFGIGTGRLTHTTDGFTLTSDDGKLRYEQKPLASHSLNADFNWYEIGDMIGIGNHEALYYCFPKIEGDIVAKARLAAEEIYKIERKKSRTND